MLLDVSKEFVELVENNSKLAITYEEFYNLYTNKDYIHNHTIGNLFLYFDLEKHLNKNRVFFYPGAVLIIDNRKHKLFVFDNDIFLLHFDFSSITDEVKKKIIIYSSVIQNSYKELGFVESKLKESVYNLQEVFSEETYYEKYRTRTVKEIKKKIYNKIKYPFLFLEKNSDKFRVENLDVSKLDEVDLLHKDWVDFKLNDPKTFKMMFSSNRYNRCVRMMFESKFLHRIEFYAKCFYWEDKLIAVRQCLLTNDGRSYDIGFFSRFWEVPSNLIFYINSFCLKDLHDNYSVQYHNTGMVLDKNLTMSKAHFPNTDKITYKYNFK